MSRALPRLALALAVAICCGCDKGDAKGGASSTGGGTTSDTPKVSANEQARFDAERRPEKVVEAMKIGPGSRVADIGAGSGLLTVHLARAVKPDGRVVATDIDARVLELLHARVQAADLADVVEERVVGPETSGLEPGTYDAILLAEVDHHFSEPVAWIKNAAVALKPTGRIVISNRVHHRARSKAAATKAGLVLEDESSPVPSHFIMSFVLPGASGSASK